MDCKRKILFVATFPPPIHGSAIMSQYIKNSNLINRSFECDYVNISTSRKIDEIGKKNLLKIIRFLRAFFNLLLKLSLYRYSICYLAITCHGLGFLKDAPFVLLCKLFRRRVVIHQHNKGMAKNVNNLIYRWLLSLVYKNTSVILLSWNLYDDVSAIVKKEQIQICPNGIPMSIKKHINVKRNNKVPHILFLSNLLVEKGVFVLLDAVKLLKDCGYSFICDFVGGETKELSSALFVSEVEKRGLKGDVVYHGLKFGKDKKYFFENADVFVLPTCNDTFGLVIIEAMEYKIPVISTNEGAIPDIIKDKITGLICEKRNPESLANCLKVLLDNPDLREQIGENAYRQFKEQYTLDAFERNLLNCINRCLK